MSIEGTHMLGPDNGTLSVKTGRSGAAAKAGHDLVHRGDLVGGHARVGAASVDARRPTPARCAWSRAPGGMQALDDDDKANIRQTIDDEVLKRERDRASARPSVERDGGRITVRGDLTLGGATHPIAFDVTLARRRQAQRQRGAEAVATGASSPTRPCSAR